MMLPKGLRRVRKPNYTREETEILLDQLLNYGNFLFGKSQPGVNNQHRADVWASIACMVNSVPNSAGRTVEELKHRWQDLAQRARAALRKHSDNKEQLLQKHMPYMDKVLRIMGEVRPDSISSRGSHSPSHSNDTSDPDTSCRVEIKQEKFDVEKESPVILNQTMNSLKRVLTPLKTPSLKQFKGGKNYDPPTVPELAHCSQNGVSSLASSFPSLSHNLRDCTQSPSAHTSHGGGKPSSVYFSSQSHTQSRPMVMDPESQLIMEVDLMEENNQSSTSTEDNKDNDLVVNKDGTSTSSEAYISRFRDDAHLNFTGNASNGIHFGSTQEPRSKPKSASANKQSCEIADETDDDTEIQSFDTMSTPQLQRLCLIGKIRLQNQQRLYVKLKEKRVRLELEFLKNRVSFPSMAKTTESSFAYPPAHSPVSSIHNADNSDECQHLLNLTPFPASGAMEFEVAGVNVSKHANDKILETDECIKLETSKDNDACVNESEGDGHGESDIVIESVHSEADGSHSENHHETCE